MKSSESAMAFDLALRMDRQLKTGNFIGDRAYVERARDRFIEKASRLEAEGK